MLTLKKTKIELDDPNFATVLASIESDFINEISKPRTYSNYIFKYHSDHISPSAVFNKFIQGDSKYHKKMSYDNSRIQRLHWIHEILDYMIANNFLDPNGEIALYYCEDKKTYYIVHKKSKYVIFMNETGKNTLMIGSAFIPDEQYYNRIINHQFCYSL